MNSETILIEVIEKVADLKNHLDLYRDKVKEEIKSLEEANKLQFDIEHFIENIELEKDESYRLSSRLHELRKQRRVCKNGIRLMEINNNQLDMMERTLSKINLTDKLEERTYHVRSQEGFDLLRTINAASVRSTIPIILQDGRTYESPRKEYKTYQPKLEEPVIEAEQTQNTLSEEQSTMNVPEQTIEQPKEEFNISSETQKLLDSVVGFSHVVTKYNRLWVVKKDKKILIRSSKLSKIVDYLMKHNIIPSIEYRYKKEIEYYMTKYKAGLTA